jgi:hypothetical protein
MSDWYRDTCDYKKIKGEMVERTERSKTLWWENNAYGSIEPASSKMSLILEAYTDYRISENWEENY